MIFSIVKARSAHALIQTYSPSDPMTWMGYRHHTDTATAAIVLETADRRIQVID